MFEFGKITSKHTNETVSVTYAWVGKGRKTVHLSPLNDETLCGRVISEYTDASEGSVGVLCSRCWKSFQAREVLADAAVTVQGDVDVPACITTADGPVGEFDYDTYQEELHNDPEVMRMVAAYDAAEKAHTFNTCDVPACAECAVKLYEECQASHVGNKPCKACETYENDQKTAVVGVQQSRPGFGGEPTHYHATGCRDITREMNRWMQSESDLYAYSVSSVAEIQDFEFGDIATDNHVRGTQEWWSEVEFCAEEMVRIMPCLTLPEGIPPIESQEEPSILECMFCGKYGVTLDHLHFRPVWLLLEQGVSVESAIVPQDAPNGSSFGSLRELSRWWRKDESETGEQTVQKLMAMINEAPDMFSLYEMPNQDVAVAWSWATNGEIGTVFYVTLPKREFTCYGKDGAAVHLAPCAEATGANGPCCAIEADGTDLNDAGFIETMVECEYKLSVDVDGARLDLGWYTFQVNAAQVNDHAAVAEIYGKAYGIGNPRHGWASIIHVNSVSVLRGA